ncbi:PH domain-containing protein [Sphingomonas sp. BT-65]|uniref:PH domain-containing protein n=1 Tax=Sphingomonas sp. BT-65 TaxID=2989821 RepID=UPI002236B4A6|nr:PH domain-containing protein [Sphingomonas sp. BT-65]MCW4463619.1 PH domain-containing protein [Sphingomonas sp. BT-65]
MSDSVTDHGPKRVHPGSIAIDFLRRAPQTVIGLPAIAGWTSGRGIGWILLAAVVVGAVMLFFTWIGWRRFTYTVGARELVIERGLLNRSRRSIPLERIQDVSIERKPLARLFGLAEVRVETGGGEKDEAVLDSVSVAEAERLRAALRGQASGIDMFSVDEGNADTPESASLPIIFQMSLPRVLLLGAFSFSLVWIAALFGGLQFFDQFLDLGFDQVRDWAEVARDEVQARFSIAAALSVAGIALALGVVSGVIRALLREYGFTLRAGAGRFRRTRGLLTRSEVVVAMRRIQLAMVQRGPLRGLFGWNALSVQTLGGSNDPSGRQAMAPLAREHEVARIVDIAGLPPFERLPLRPVAAGHVIRSLVLALPWPMLVIGAAVMVTPLAWFGLLLLIPLAIAALLQRRFHRYALRHTSLQVMRGVIAQRDWIVPFENVQVVTLRAGWLQRRLGIASVLVDTAGAGGGGAPDVVDLNLPDARALAAGLVERIG